MSRPLREAGGLFPKQPLQTIHLLPSTNTRGGFPRHARRAIPRPYREHARHTRLRQSIRGGTLTRPDLIRNRPSSTSARFGWRVLNCRHRDVAIEMAEGPVDLINSIALHPLCASQAKRQTGNRIVVWEKLPRVCASTTTQTHTPPRRAHATRPRLDGRQPRLGVSSYKVSGLAEHKDERLLGLTLATHAPCAQNHHDLGD